MDLHPTNLSSILPAQTGMVRERGGLMSWGWLFHGTIEDIIYCTATLINYLGGILYTKQLARTPNYYYNISKLDLTRAFAMCIKN
jgi:hypothetical protein